MSEQNTKSNGKSPLQETIPAQNLQGENEINNIEEIQLESNYQSAINFMNCISCMTPYEDKVNMYHTVANQFVRMSGYKDADQYAEECRQLEKQTVVDIKKFIYKNAVKRKERAKLPEDYIAAAEQFRQLGNYKDSEALAEACSRLGTKIGTKAYGLRLFKIGLFIVCIIALIAIFNTKQAKYYVANFNEMTGSYTSAIQSYKNLGTYKDSPDRLQETRYKYACSSEKRGKYSTARNEFYAAGNYKDSPTKVVTMEKMLLRKGKNGDKVKIGDNSWYIVDKTDNNALLVKSSVITNLAFNKTAGNTTWETSSLRHWLNSDFIKQNLIDTESKQLVLTDTTTPANATYNTSGGNATKDYIFLLSETEATQYLSKLPQFKHNCWLRTPGKSQDSAEFLSVYSGIMTYGYDVTSTQIGVYPVMWYSYK